MININFTPMITAQNDHMLDKCNLIGYTLTYDDYGAEVRTPVVNSGVSCGFSYVRTWDKDNGVWLSNGDTANLRLPIGTSYDSITDVVIVSGVAASGTWNTAGQPQIGNTCILISLTKGTL